MISCFIPFFSFSNILKLFEVLLSSLSLFAYIFCYFVIDHYHETLGEALQGTELEFSGLEIQFKEALPKTEYCKIDLETKNLKPFIYAVKNHYWYQMYLGRFIIISIRILL